MTLLLEQVLADARGQAAVLRHNGHKLQADSIERVCEAVAEAMRDYLDWLTDDEAALTSGRSVFWIRNRFAAWEAIGMAKREGTGRRSRRLYRRCIVPRRPNVVAAYQAGREGVT